MKRIQPKSALFCSLVVLIILFGGGVYSARSQDNEVITVTVAEHQSIRDIAKEYLNDPNLWMDILRANGLNSPHEIL